MARPLRIEYPGALYHVTSRGDRQESIFDDDQDRRAFLNVMGEVVSRFRWRCHSYCLMGNHYHLMIETPEANLTKGMRQLNGVCTQWSNRRHQRSGHFSRAATKPSWSTGMRRLTCPGYNNGKCAQAQRDPSAVQASG